MLPSPRALVPLLIIACLARLPAQEPAATRPAATDLAGHWAGEIRLPTGKLEIDLDFARSADGSWTGDITIPAQNAKDLPLIGIKLDGREARFAIDGVPGDPTFEGEADEAWSAMDGDYKQSGQPFRFKITRSAAAGPDVVKNLEGIADWIEEARGKWKVPAVAVGIVRGDQTILARGFGLRDVERQLPATADTLFAIGSSTKAFTTFALATLVEEGKLDWDKPVRTWLPELRLKDEWLAEHLSPRDLVTHRSGLPRHDMIWYGSHLTRAEMVERLRWLEPSKDLRTTFQYNNLMYVTAGYLAERVTGKSWEEVVRDRILIPLGMPRTNFSVTDSQADADCALPYRIKDDKLERMPFRDITHVGPAGSINSSITEMLAWARLHLGGARVGGRQLLQKASLAELHAVHMATGQAASTPEVEPMGYGLGWFNDVYRGHRRVHHGGAIDGFQALVCLVPAQRLGIVVLTNLNGTPLPDLVARTVIDRALDLPRRDWSGEALARRDASEASQKVAKSNKSATRKKGTQPAHPLEEYAGDYVHPGYGPIRIELADGRLSGTFNGMTAPLEHWHYEVFRFVAGGNDFALEDRQLRFDTGFDGEVEALRLAIEPLVAPAVFERKPEARMTDPAWLGQFTGEYALAGQTCRVELKGTALAATLPGQPVYELVPRRGTTFEFKGLTGFRAVFELDDKGTVKALLSDQPSGAYRMLRKK